MRGAKIEEVRTMNERWVLIDREVLLTEMQQVFDARTAGVMLHVLDRVAAQVRQAGVTREDFRELKQIVAELAEAQRSTTEEIKELAAAQARAEERIGRLEAAVERLTEAQRQTSAAVRELTAGIDHLRKQVGGLSETVGGDIEDIAYIVLHDVLKREFGWQVGVLEREWQTWDGEPEEVNVFGEATDPARPGQAIWIVGEAKHNLTAKEVDRFARQVGRARRHLVGEIFPVCFCYRARPEVQQQVRDAGIRLVFSYGKLV
jgi:F0F1-type ATP synthase membrane subunit b/b'